ncbi:transposase [Moorena sp. SIO1F2]|uniref:transposase n=1 Tax=Moorena sp. SIO1F2 TaxID=2607819 RepID=UPI00345BB3F7
MPHRRESQILRDLSDTEWEVLKPLLPEPIGFGHPRTVDLTEILNGVFYVHWTCCQWEMLPHDLPPYTTVYGYFQKWQRRGIWQKIHDQLRSQIRFGQGRELQSTVGIADSQSVKTTEKRGQSAVLMVVKKRCSAVLGRQRGLGGPPRRRNLR